MAMPAQKDSLILCSDRLLVEIARPGTVYRGTRFDWSAFITQVTLDDEHTFCAPEAEGNVSSTGGNGLCNEFGNDLPIGYLDARPGESFPKLGIGLLTRPDEAPYNFFRPYDIAQPFPIQVETLENMARFEVEPVECRGYAARLVKTITARGNTLTLDYRLENTGRMPIATNEYCHNFLCIDKHMLGPEYRLRFPYTPRREPPPDNLYQMAPLVLRRFLPRFLVQKLVERIMKRMEKALILDGQEIRWRETPKDAFYSRLLGSSQTARPQWELVHLPSGVRLCEIDDFTPARVAVWGRAHVVSAEVFVDIRLQPGESQTWTRQYEFFKAHTE